jgi:hypothetical protein
LVTRNAMVSTGLTTIAPRPPRLGMEAGSRVVLALGAGAGGCAGAATAFGAASLLARAVEVFNGSSACEGAGFFKVAPEKAGSDCER